MNPKSSRKVVGLIRVSTDGQAGDDRGGLPRQLEVISRTVAVQKLVLIETIALKGVSGTEVRQNKEVQRVLRMIETQEIGGVVVADLDRLMRPAAGQDYALLDPFIQAKATIFAAGTEFDFGSPASALMVKLFLSFAEFERSMIINRSRGAVRELCKAGQHPFGKRQLPRGISYDRKTRTWSTNETIAPVLEAFRLIDEDGVHNIAEVARRVGVHERAMHNLIRNPLYSGYRIYSTGREPNKVVSRYGRAYKRKTPLPEDEIIRVQVLNPPPVAEDRFVRVQQVLAATLKNWKGEREDRPTYNLLRSVARCGHCDSRLYFSQDRRRPNLMGYYFCSCNYYRKGKKGTCGSTNQSKAELDSATISFITELLTKPAALRAIFAHSEVATKANQEQPTVEKTESATFQTRRRRLKDGYEAGVISVVELRERLKKIDLEEEAVKRVAKSQAAKLAAPQTERLIRLIVKGAHAFRRVTDPTWRLRAIQRLFSAVFYEGGQITKFKLQPNLIQDSVCEEHLFQGWGSLRRRA